MFSFTRNDTDAYLNYNKILAFAKLSKIQKFGNTLCCRGCKKKGILITVGGTAKWYSPYGGNLEYLEDYICVHPLTQRS